MNGNNANLPFIVNVFLKLYETLNGTYYVCRTHISNKIVVFVNGNNIQCWKDSLGNSLTDVKMSEFSMINNNL